jgi:hypothetical protein
VLMWGGMDECVDITRSSTMDPGVERLACERKECQRRTDQNLLLFIFGALRQTLPHNSKLYTLWVCASEAPRLRPSSCWAYALPTPTPHILLIPRSGTACKGLSSYSFPFSVFLGPMLQVRQNDSASRALYSSSTSLSTHMHTKHMGPTTRHHTWRCATDGLVDLHRTQSPHPLTLFPALHAQQQHGQPC